MKLPKPLVILKETILVGESKTLNMEIAKLHTMTKLKIPVITGEIELDLSNLSDLEYKIIVELLKIGYFIFAGHYRELGYGMYSFY